MLTEPAGANVYMKEYVDNASEWTFLGVTPLEKFRVPIGIFRWKMDKEGFDEGMVRVPKTGTKAGTLDDPSWVRPTTHIWCAEQQAWVHIDDAGFCPWGCQWNPQPG